MFDKIFNSGSTIHELYDCDFKFKTTHFRKQILVPLYAKIYTVENL